MVLAGKIFVPLAYNTTIYSHASHNYGLVFNLGKQMAVLSDIWA